MLKLNCVDPEARSKIPDSRSSSYPVPEEAEMEYRSVSVSLHVGAVNVLTGSVGCSTIASRSACSTRAGRIVTGLSLFLLSDLVLSEWSRNFCSISQETL